MALFEPTSQWHEIELPDLTFDKNLDKDLSIEKIAEKKSYAKSLLKQENEKVDMTSRLSTSDRNFVSNIMTSGTLSDRVSALTLLIQESPLHSLKTLDTMLTMTKKKGRQEAVMALQSLKDLFAGSVLPDRKLIYFADRPLGCSGVDDRHLLLWYFEDHLKKFYFQVVQQIEALSHDPLVHVRDNMVRCIHDLLSSKPEQEQNLLKLLVNKLGDSENKVASRASQMLVDLLIAHPGMKMIVVREIEQLLLRPNTPERAQYYSLITLNQTILTAKESDVANKLIEIYFVSFRRILKLTEEEEEKQLNSDDEEQEKEGKDKKKSKKQQQKGKKGGKKGKKGNQKKSSDNNDTGLDVDELQVKMVGAILTGVNRAFHFAKMADETVEKHLEILFKITHAGKFYTAVQALSLIFTISLAKQTVSDRFYRTLYESMLDNRLLITSKQTQYLNLLFKAVRADADMRRVKAFVKRMIQIASHHQPPFICGLLYLLNQLLISKPALRTMLTTPEEDEEEEHFVDAPSSDEDEEDTEKKNTPKKNQTTLYDGRKRDPRFSNAETSCLWELIPFRKHYHPTVAFYAEQLFTGEKIEGEPDMHNNTLIHFLDRFVYRNPKKKTGTRGKSIMQPLAGRQDGGIMMTRGNVDEINTTLVNSVEFWRKKIEQVPVDEIFFHKYFKQKREGEPMEEELNRSQKRSKLEQDEEEGALSDHDGGMDEDEVWRAMTSSIPGGLDDDDIDEDEDDFDDEMRQLLLDEDDDLNDDSEDNDNDSDMGSVEMIEAPLSDSE
ncbi:CBF/Mak21 family-domain-containing protein [Phascolomyces articulosus]|uniref:CBF/Mak21 family-domain-containing protein n=1 Tax=Phascolomyces articulosus TaxID=60185 RepID=A0AAD5K6L1_9FUNG|nr:CBF/Mak21 family-domain-containing protein [Phascolomyces articulosus]